MNNVLTGLIIAALLLVGVFCGAVFFPMEKEVEVEKLVNVTVEKIVEVPSNVTCEECEVPISTLQLAVNDFMEAVEDEEDEAGENDLEWVSKGFDFDEISISKLYDDYSVVVEDDVTTVNFDIKLKYKETGEESEKFKYSVTVIYEDDEDTEVEVDDFE